MVEPVSVAEPVVAPFPPPHDSTAKLIAARTIRRMEDPPVNGCSHLGGLAAKGSAVSGVWLVTLLPALLFGPLAGAVADRLDRRMTMIVGDVMRGRGGCAPGRL